MLQLGEIISDFDVYEAVYYIFWDSLVYLLEYGLNQKHFTDTPSGIYGGSTSWTDPAFRNIPSNFSKYGEVVTASEIVNYVTSEVAKFTRVRLVRVNRYQTQTGYADNEQRRLNSLQTVEGITHVSSGNTSSWVPPSSTSIRTGATIIGNNLNNYLTSARNNLNNAAYTALNYDYDVCHSSCHSACHGSRSRR